MAEQSAVVPADVTRTESWAVLRDGTWVLIRPLTVKDVALYRDFLSRVTDDDLRLRFFASMKSVSDVVIDALVHYDPARAMAFIVLDEQAEKLLGVGRLHDDKDMPESAEFAILVASQVKAHGIGWLLLERILDYAKLKGIKKVHGFVLPENTTMLKMCAEFGFHIEADGENPGVRAVTLKV